MIAGGPFIGIIFLLLFPSIFGIPIAYITAELSTAYPQDGKQYLRRLFTACHRRTRLGV